MIFDDDDEVFIGKSYGHTRVYSEQSAAAIDEEIARIIDKAYNDVLDLLNEKMVILNAVANRLLEKEKIEGPEFEQIYVSGGVIPADTSDEASDASEKAEDTASENAGLTADEMLAETASIEKAVEDLEKKAEASDEEEKKEDQ